MEGYGGFMRRGIRGSIVFGGISGDPECLGGDAGFVDVQWLGGTGPCITQSGMAGF